MPTTIVQLNLIDLDVHVTNIDIHLDPGAAFVETDAAPSPAVAPPTAGPHRYTINVPHDDASIFSVGQGCATRIADTGITGRTNTHIHFETRETAKTIVSLGGPTEDAMIFSYDEPVLGSSAGYAMVTEGVAWNESAAKFYVVSQGEDVTVRALQSGKRVVMQADHGHVDAIAGETVNLVSKTVTITSPSEPEPADVNYAGAWSNQVPKMHNASNWAHATEIAALALTAVDLALEAKTFYSSMKKWKKDSASPYVKPALTAGHWVATAARVGLTTAHVVHAMAHHETPGCVKISTEKDFGAVSGGGSIVFGKTGATVGSAMFATVVAPLVTLEGVLFAGVAARHSSLFGLAGVEIAAPLGTVFIEGKKEVEIDCHGEIRIGGHEDVFMRSGHHGAYVHGHSKGYLGAGGSDGFGVLAKPAEVTLGKMTSGDNLPAAAIDPDCAITVKADSVTVYHKQAGMAVRDNKVTLQSNGRAGELLIDGSEIKVEGARIMLG